MVSKSLGVVGDAHGVAGGGVSTRWSGVLLAIDSGASSSSAM
jgi:hypothetical protein